MMGRLIPDAKIGGYWKLEDANDSGLYNHDLTGFNSPTHTLAKFGNGMVCNNSAVYRNDSAAEMDYSSVYTVGIWVKRTANDDSTFLDFRSGSNGDYVIFEVDANGYLSVVPGTTGSYSTGVVLTLNKFFLVGASRTGSSVYVYIDGVPYGPYTPGTNNAGFNTHTLGYRYATSGSYFQGVLDEAFCMNEYKTPQWWRRYYLWCRGMLV